MHKLIEASVFAAIGVLVFASLLIPVVDQATATTDTFKNDGVFNYGIFNPDDEYTLTVTESTGDLTVNGSPVTIDAIDLTHYGSYSIIASDNFLLRYGTNNSGYFVQLVGVDENNISLLKGGSFVVSISGGKIVCERQVTPAETYTFDFDEIYAIVPSVDNAVMKVSTSEVYIKGESPLYGSGLTTVSAWSNMFHFEGTYKDGITISSPNVAGATYDNIVWNIDPVAGYLDLYKLTSIEFDITYNDTVTHAVYSYFGVPSSVTAEKAIHADEPTREVLEIMPLILIAGLIIGVLGYAVYSRIE